MIKLKEVYYVMGWMKKNRKWWVGQHLISFSLLKNVCKHNGILQEPGSSWLNQEFKAELPCQLGTSQFLKEVLIMETSWLWQEDFGFVCNLLQ